MQSGIEAEASRKHDGRCSSYSCFTAGCDAKNYRELRLHRTPAYRLHTNTIVKYLICSIGIISARYSPTMFAHLSRINRLLHLHRP
jgi:hypothetical protein